MLWFKGDMPSSRPASAQLPVGVQDRIFGAAERKRRIEKTLERAFEARGYREIITPTFEHYDVFARGMGEGALARVYRFFDPDGRLLALRADATSAVARVVATKLATEPLPIRVRYCASIFRREPPHAGKFAEFTQAGIECLGGRGAGAEVEILLLTAAACRALGLRRFQINIGHVGFALGLLEEARLQGPASNAVQDAIDRKDIGALESHVSGLRIPERVRRALLAIPHLVGGSATLREAGRLAVGARSRAAVAHLASLGRRLKARGFGDHGVYDFGEVRGLGYYTGIMFQVYIEGLGFPVAAGGRYDDLCARFGRALPAVGFSFGIERVEQVRN